MHQRIIRNTPWILCLFLAAACGGNDGEAPSAGMASNPDDSTAAASDDQGDVPDPPSGGEATETNVQPAPCNSASDCPEGIACMQFTDEQTGQPGPGFCDVNEAVVGD